MKNTKITLGLFAGCAVAMIMIIAMAHASTALTVSCSGSVSGNQITWTATSSGGNAPYSFLWAGDGGIANATNTSVVGTYNANGTYMPTVQVTDASSSVATTTCSGSVISFPAATSTLSVIVSVNNAAGGSAVPDNFLVSVTGANAVPSSFAGSEPVTVNANTAYSVGIASAPANYAMTTSGNCSGPISAGVNNSCTVTETFVAPSTMPTSTPVLPRVNPPTLSIGQNGAFLARGMTVTSVASSSFQGTVWGITYTINWSGLFPEFYFRLGNGGSSTSSPVTNVAVGDEVGVSGRIVSSSSPMTVNANVVRDYSITQARPGKREGDDESQFYNSKGNGEENQQGNNENGSNLTMGSAVTGSSSVDVNTRFQNLLNQFHNLQSLFAGHGNGGDH